MSRKLSHEEQDEIKAAYGAHIRGEVWAPQPDLARRYGVSTMTIYRVLRNIYSPGWGKKWGVEPGRRALLEEQIRAGRTAREVREEFGIGRDSYHRVRRLMEKENGQ